MVEGGGGDEEEMDSAAAAVAGVGLEESLVDVDVDEEGGGGLGEGVKVRGGLVAGLIQKVFAIERHELRKFLFMSVMMFAIIYVFTMTRWVVLVLQHDIH